MKNRQKGFTLLEVVIALGILAIVMTTLAGSWNGNLRRVRKSKLKTQAVYLLQKKATEIETIYKNDVRSLPTDLQKGKFEGERFKKFSWEWEANEFEMPDIARLFTQDEGIVDEMTLKVIRQMRDYLEESIKEVKITLIYKASAKAAPQKFSLATIFVDYDTPLNLGFGGAGAPGGLPSGEAN
jgi:prepilin-type N-terminal cleavage/methylation domain-containing protein